MMTDCKSENELFKYFVNQLGTINNNIIFLNILRSNDLLDESFEDRYILYNDVKIIQNINKEVLTDNFVTYFFEELSGLPLKLELKKVNDHWKIKSYMFQCQGCFGEDEKCNVCGGTGWGVF